MLKVIRGRLGAWGNKFVSLGGRIVLINAVLSAIPVFYLSFMKMPVKVWKEVVKIQRSFLWGGLSKRSHTCWVKWDDICRPKKEGGLGIRDLRLVNSSLLAKWRWKLLSHEKEGWKDVIISKYGSEVIGFRNLGGCRITGLASNWWRNVCTLDKDSNWFAEAVVKRVGVGNRTLFWKEVWIGDLTLQDRFPRIFNISEDKDNTISSLGFWERDVWRWAFNWRRALFEREVPMFADFSEVVQGFTPSDRDDVWLWKENMDDGFSASSCYLLLVDKFRGTRVLDDCVGFAFSKVWKCGAPSKVCAFAWQALLDRIPSKENLRKRHILQPPQSVCVLCGLMEESTVHLFLHCEYSSKVWYKIMNWLCLVIIVPPNLCSSFGSLLSSGRDKKEKICLATIWNSFLWSIWKFRNDCVFKNKLVVFEDLVDHVKFQSWKWFIAKVARSPCLLYEWNWSPRDCFHR
jgi:hypothetical protein